MPTPRPDPPVTRDSTASGIASPTGPRPSGSSPASGSAPCGSLPVSRPAKTSPTRPGSGSRAPRSAGCRHRWRIPHPRRRRAHHVHPPTPGRRARRGAGARGRRVGRRPAAQCTSGARREAVAHLDLRRRASPSRRVAAGRSTHALAEACRAVEALAPSAVDVLSRADRGLIAAIADPGVGDAVVDARSAARRRFATPAALLPAKLGRIAAREAPLRFSAATWLAARG